MFHASITRGRHTEIRHVHTSHHEESFENNITPTRENMEIPRHLIENNQRHRVDDVRVRQSETSHGFNNDAFDEHALIGGICKKLNKVVPTQLNLSND